MAEQKQSTELAKLNINDLMHSPIVVKKLQDCLIDPKTTNGFISSVISVATSNTYLKKCQPMTILGAAMVAATLQLPIVPTLGMAYIIPYGTQAQFQIGYKGLLQLAMRSGEFKNIIDEPVYKGQLVKKNKFTGEYVFDEDAREKDKDGNLTNEIIGYMARIDLVNGFSKTIFWTVDEVKTHATKFSQAYQKGYTSPWKSDFDAMARKTVLKHLINKYAPKTIQMENAIRFDQAAVKINNNGTNLTEEDLDINAFGADYIDNDQPPIQDANAEEVDPSKGLFGDGGEGVDANKK